MARRDSGESTMLESNGSYKSALPPMRRGCGEDAKTRARLTTSISQRSLRLADPTWPSDRSRG